MFYGALAEVRIHDFFKVNIFLVPRLRVVFFSFEESLRILFQFYTCGIANLVEPRLDLIQTQIQTMSNTRLLIRFLSFGLFLLDICLLLRGFLSFSATQVLVCSPRGFFFLFPQVGLGLFHTWALSTFPTWFLFCSSRGFFSW